MLCCLMVCVCEVHQFAVMTQWVVWPLAPLIPLSLSFSSFVCVYSSRCVRRCCGSSKGLCCVGTVYKWGVGGQRLSCDRGPWPWRSGERVPLLSALAMVNFVGARDCRSPCPTDWHKRQRWLPEAVVTSAYAPSADASRDSGCVQGVQPGPPRLLHTVRRA